MLRLILPAVRRAGHAVKGQRPRHSAWQNAVENASRTCASTAEPPLRSFSTAPVPAVETMEVFVDGIPVQVPKGSTALQACDEAGVEIPRFCYHSRLSIAGNCRMCLVEVEKAPKPQASCALPAMPGMKIKTNTPVVKKAREGVMEFLLLNHPLDCPICDQGGECDLQDQAMVYGSDRGRFIEYKRSVEDKNLGPLVKTVMTRCIHCTRCVRFAKEIAGVEDLGITGRGRDSEIGTYIERMLTSEVSGNIIDLCPVGALTSKPFAFTARSWELKSTETIDVSDAINANIRVDSRGSEVMRILPRLNEEVNEEWLSDKARFWYDGLKRQRLASPMVRNTRTGRLEASDWHTTLRVVADALARTTPDEIVGVAGKFAEAEAVIAFKDLLTRLGAVRLHAEGAAGHLSADLRSTYLLNTGLLALEEADCALLVGTDPRVEAPLLNLRLRKGAVAGRMKVANVGPALDLTYACEHLGEGPAVLGEIADGRHPFCSALANAQRPVLLVGAGAFAREDSAAVVATLHKITEMANIVKEGWNGFNVLHLWSGGVTALDLGFVPGPTAAEITKPPAFAYLLGADDAVADLPKSAFVVYQGHHGDAGASRADVVLPGTAFTEKDATYVNTEGRVQQTLPAVPIVGNARDDWKILRALSEVVGEPLPYDTLSQVRKRMGEVAPHLAHVDTLEDSSWLNGDAFGHIKETTMSSTPFEKVITNFYATDPISRASKTMAKCTAAREKMEQLQLH